MTDPTAIEAEVRRYYASAAVDASDGAAACCDSEADCFGAGLYDTLEGLPGRGHVGEHRVRQPDRRRRLASR
jgi:hypothetical protein